MRSKNSRKIPKKGKYRRKKQKNSLHGSGKPISSAYRKIVLGGTTGRRTNWCGGLYLLVTKRFWIFLFAGQALQKQA
jgi:hypothetical protein